jgi:predicted PurR-regulated permease PerM
LSDNLPSALLSTQWSLPAHYFIGVLLIVLAAVMILLLLPLLEVLFLAFLISFLIFLPTRALKRRTRLPYALIIAVFFLALFGLLIYALLTLIPNLINAFSSMWLTVQERYDQLAAQLSTAVPAISYAFRSNFGPTPHWLYYAEYHREGASLHGSSIHSPQSSRFTR